MSMQRYRGHTIEVTATEIDCLPAVLTCISTARPAVVRMTVTTLRPADDSACGVYDAAFTRGRAWVDAHPLTWPQIQSRLSWRWCGKRTVVR